MKRLFLSFLVVTALIFGVFYHITPYKMTFSGEKRDFYSTESVRRYIELKNLEMEKILVTLSEENTAYLAEMKNSDLAGFRYDTHNILRKISFNLTGVKSVFGIYSEIPYITDFNNDLLNKNIEKICSVIEKKPVPDILRKEKEFYRLVRGNSGIRVLKQEFSNRIIQGFRKNDMTIYIPVGILDPIPVEDKPVNIPDIPISEFYTEFDMSNNSRIENLKVAANAINGLIIAPGQKFSFNDFVGERTYSKGYKDAGVVVNGQIVDGIAGGICQVTSTLYNSALYSGIEIVKRYPHSIYDPEWAYTERGLDSAVAFPYKDLVIRNDRNDNILLTMEFSGNRLYCRIFGEYQKGFDVRLVTGNPHFIKFSTKTIFDDKLSKGEKKIVTPGLDGSIIESFRVFTYPDGREKKEFLARDTYRKVDRVEKIGIK